MKPVAIIMGFPELDQEEEQLLLAPVGAGPPVASAWRVTMTAAAVALVPCCRSRIAAPAAAPALSAVPDLNEEVLAEGEERKVHPQRRCFAHQTFHQAVVDAAMVVAAQEATHETVLLPSLWTTLRAPSLEISTLAAAGMVVAV